MLELGELQNRNRVSIWLYSTITISYGTDEK